VGSRAVLFDVGETLVHPHPSFPELLSSTLRAEGLTVDPASIREAVHVLSDRFEVAARDKELWSTSLERSRAFWASVYGILLAELGIELDDRLAARIYETFTDLANYRAFDDVEPVLRLLQGRGLALGVVSNFEAWLERLLESLELARYFDVRVISGAEGVEKPDPAIFRLALDRMGVPASESVYVGDSPFFDIEPAMALGMGAILLDRRERHPDHPGLRIATLAELPALLGMAA
jgi:putative hydrolase of the HAD superfamily